MGRVPLGKLPEQQLRYSPNGAADRVQPDLATMLLGGAVSPAGPAWLQRGGALLRMYI